jgi:hypothetical protein
LLLHRFEQRALGLGASAVDLVGQQHLREYRPWMEDETLAAAFENTHADQVGRHQVGGELDARELQPQRQRQCMRQRGFADPRNVLDQQVAGGQQAGHAVFDLRSLANDDRANLIDQPRQLTCKAGIHPRHLTRKDSRLS